MSRIVVTGCRRYRLQFGSDPTYEEHVRLVADILAALPTIDGWKPQSHPMDVNSIGQCRLDAKEVGEITAEIALGEEIEAPGRAGRVSTLTELKTSWDDPQCNVGLDCSGG